MKQVSTDDLWDHQREYVEKFSLVPAHIQLWEPRTGKTRATCKGFVRAILEDSVFRVLITGPKAGCKEVWLDDEVPKALLELPDDLPYKIVGLLDIPIVDRKFLLEELVRERRQRIETNQSPRVEVVIVNRDALHQLEKQLLAWNPQYFIVDELHKFKHSGSLRSRTAFNIQKVARYRRGLTGTPAARTYSDLYGQWKCIEPKIFGTSKSAFEERYCIFPPSKWQTKPTGYKNLEELREKAFSIASIRFRKDCFDVPDQQDVIREIYLPKAARDVYNNVVQQHVLELESTKVPMTHTLSRMMQLRQIAIGYSRYDNEDQERTTKWLHNAKIESVAEDVDEVVVSGGKVIVFHAFLPEGYALRGYLKSHGIEAGLINGQEGYRSEVIAAFQHGDLQCVIVQEETASESISLSAADYTTFLSHGPSGDTHKQASDRSFKPQNEARSIKLVRTYHRMKGTVEVSLFNMVKQQLSMEEQLLSGPIAETFKSLAFGELV